MTTGGVLIEFESGIGYSVFAQGMGEYAYRFIAAIQRTDSRLVLPAGLDRAWVAAVSKKGFP
jgi:hypothetical protein